MLSISSFLNAVGLTTLCLFLFKLLNLVFIYLRPSRLSRFSHNSVNGSPPWALVTGASNGIGRAFAYELAATGYNVILHGRNQESLDDIMIQLQSKFPHRTFSTLVADANLVPCATCLTDSGPLPELEAIYQKLSHLHLTVLINNAGGGPGVYDTVQSSSEISITSNISLNALFPHHLTRILLPQLIRNSPSLVINISTMGDTGFPLIASYSASKSFLMAATRAIRLEMSMNDEKVEILGVRVGRVTDTKGCREPSSIFLPSATTVAKAALMRAGYDEGIVVGYWAHALQQLSASMFVVLPRWVEDAVKINIMRKQRELHQRNFKKE